MTIMNPLHAVAGKGPAGRPSLPYFLLFLLVALLGGCAGPDAPNRKNFTEAINRSIADSIFINLDELPVAAFNGGHGGRRLSKLEQRFEPGDHYLKVPKSLIADSRMELFLDDLVRHGVLIPWMQSYYTGQGLFDRPVDIYLFKAAGLRYARPVRQAGQTGYAFFCGRPVVDRILGWVEPRVSNGTKITSVRFRARLADVPDWSSRLGGYLDASLRSEHEAMLVLTPNGWRTP